MARHFPLDGAARVHGRPWSWQFGKIPDKAVRKTKQVVAEVTGNGKLAEEGKISPKNENEPTVKPFGIPRN